jgi:hypothetical protein
MQPTPVTAGAMEEMVVAPAAVILPAAAAELAVILDPVVMEPETTVELLVVLIGDQLPILEVAEVVVVDLATAAVDTAVAVAAELDFLG